MTHSQRTLLLIDDDAVFRKRLARAFRERHFNVIECTDVGEALAALKESDPDGIICDLKMPGYSGLDFLAMAQPTLEKAPTPILMLTGHGSIASAVTAMKLGCVHYLKKPATADDILAALFESPTPLNLNTKEELSLREIEREHIEYVLHKNAGNITRSAKELGIHRRSLQRKLS